MAALVAAVTAASLQAQSPETIRGKITDDSAHALVATIMVTRGPDRLTQQTTSDASGNYSTRFEQGTGDYLVYVSAPGFKAARRRVQRQANETELIANFSLARDVTTLESVKVSATRPVRASNNISATQPDPGSSEKWNDGVFGAVSPTIAGDLYVPLGEFLARGNGAAGKAELDSVQATQKLCWKVFWEQPEIAGAVVTPAQLSSCRFSSE